MKSLSVEMMDDLRTEFRAHLDAAKTELSDQSRIADVVSSSLFSLVEVLALFVTLVGFLLGSGAALAARVAGWISRRRARRGRA